MSRAAAPIRSGLTFEQYLEFEQTASQKHELVDGQLFAMAGGSDPHSRLAVRLGAYFEFADADQGCRTYDSDMKLRTPGGEGYYPDIMVVCDADDSHRYHKTRPCLLVEVLSDSTEAIDRGEKLRNYCKIETLRAYVLLSQDEPRAEVFRREADGWRYEAIEADGILKLPCVNLELSVAELYARV
jgi:Uma2 family endonuclease